MSITDMQATALRALPMRRARWRRYVGAATRRSLARRYLVRFPGRHVVQTIRGTSTLDRYDRRSQPCNVVDQFCTARPAFKCSVTRATCFACGLAVCVECSTRRTYGRYGRVRLCNLCQIENDGNNHVVMRRTWRKAGYSGSPPSRLLMT